jgi:hypothetical protein
MWGDLLPLLPRNYSSNFLVPPPSLLETNSTGIFVDHPSQQSRILQGQRGVIPEGFVSPPSPYALSLTPKGYRSDFAIDFGQILSSLGKCDQQENLEACQILFYPPYDSTASSSSISSSSRSDDKQEDSQQGGWSTKEEENNKNKHQQQAKVGVIFYGAALVDPRSYSPIAHQLSERYGIPTSIPIFSNNLAFGFDCDTRRIDMASRAFPHVEKWVLAGHSLGGLAAMGELYHLMISHDDEKSVQSEVVGGTETSEGRSVVGIENVGGLALIASYLNQDVGCGPVDFSNLHDVAFASIDSDLDGVLNRALWEDGQSLLPKNETFFMTVLGGNHGNFGSYDDTERRTVLGQNDGNATIPQYLQMDMAVMGIMSVVSRAGVEMPSITASTGCTKKKKKSKKAKGSKS